MNRKTLILGGILIVMIASAYFYQGPLKKWQDNLGKPANFLAGIDTGKIDKIEVISGGQAIALFKLGEKWKYNNSNDFYVNPDLMAKVLSGLAAAAGSELELISNSPERKSEFKTDSAGLTVKIYQADKQIADFVIGGRTNDYAGAYISKPAAPATYSVRADLRDVFEQTEWRDLTIFLTAKEKIKKIRFQYPNREFTVEFKDDKWSGILPEKFTVSQEKIEKILTIMSSLKAAAIPEQSFKDTGLEKHLIIIEAAGEAVDNILMIGKNLDGRSYAKRGDSDNIYLINKSDRDELDKWIWQLR